ncbi:CyP450 monooxygenase [Russula aff. rugulosa BPL654]|nr:CyP450 monooxygenase [Russula aff. rugulosa BPL654]
MPVASLTSILDVLVLIFSLAAFLAIRDYQRRQGLPYPPGPRPLPLIGNLFDIPKEFSWLSYTQLSKKYGDILSFRAFGQVIVVLNSMKVNKDLLERRPDIYSDRPVIPIFDMMRWEWNVGFGNCTESWRLARKLLDRSLRPAGIAAYRPLLQTKAYALLSQVLANPEDLEAHLNRLAGSVVLAMGYGYEVKELNDRTVIAAKKMVQLMGEIALPGALLVNILPLLRHIPEWLPWLSYKPLARYGYDIGQVVLHVPMKFARESILDGTAQPSLALENLRDTERLDKREREKVEEVTARALGAMDLGGTETTPSSLIPFFVAALLRPEIQTMAQRELDAVTMRERLPTFEDRPRLPFVDAICKEVKRWRPAVPLGVPHATASDDVYEGYFIPKGLHSERTNMAVLHDPARFPEPDLFKPERFINPDGSVRDDPALSTIFGLGKRICPGRHLADALFFIIVASFLSVFNIKGDGTDGKPDSYPFTGTDRCRFLLSVPCPFPFSIVPRDRKAEELIVANAEAQ